MRRPLHSTPPPSILRTLMGDTYLNMLVVFVMLVIIMLPFLNPPADTPGMPPPGNLIAAIAWRDGPIDVDLWVDGPRDTRPVSYRRKNGTIWNLLRDDRGIDAGLINYENAFTRGLVAGEYTVNVHCYSCPPGEPIEVEVEISVNNSLNAVNNATLPILTTRVRLLPKQEMTAARFMLTEDGKLVPGSVHNVFTSLIERH